MHRLFAIVLILLGFAQVHGQILLEDPSHGQSRSKLPGAFFAEESTTTDDRTYDEMTGRAPIDEPEYKPKTGKSAATDYFKARKNQPQAPSPVQRDVAAGGDRVLGIHMGSFINDKQYRWGRLDKSEDAGDFMLGVTYRVGEWVSSMDLNFRAELITYDIDGDRPLKLSVMPIVQFPDARSEFPLYFGAGLGVGIFFEQVEDESDLSVDYALIIGSRFWDIFPNGAGLFVETGLKGQVHLLSSGQQDGVFLAVGGVFSF